MNYLDGVRIRALMSVIEPDEDAWILGVFEWYSKEFHTPLHTIQDLPLDDVLMSYYRSYYRQIEPEERHNEAIWLLESPEERSARVNNESQREDELMQRSLAQNATKKVAGSATKKIEAMLRKMKKPVVVEEPEGDGIGRRQATAGERPMLNRSIKEETELVIDTPEGEEVTVKYLPAGDLEAEMERMSGPPPKPRGLPRKPKK